MVSIKGNDKSNLILRLDDGTRNEASRCSIQAKETEIVYSIIDLQDLQSRLTLLAGKSEEGIEEQATIDYFVEVSKRFLVLLCFA